MKRWLRYALFLAPGVALTLAAVYLVLHVTRYVPENAGPLVRSLATSGALLLSIVALVLAVYLALRLAVALFDKKDEIRK